MAGDLRTELTATAKWVRLLYIVLYALMFQVAELVLGLTVAVQFLWHLFTGRVNDSLRDFGHRLGAWIAEAVRFATYASDARPWPFGNPWPASPRPGRRDD